MKKQVQTIVKTTHGTYTSDISKILLDEDDLNEFKSLFMELRTFKSFTMLVNGESMFINPKYIVAIEIKEFESKPE